MATILPPVLRPSVGGEKQLSAAGSSVGEVLRSVAEADPDTQSQLFAADGGLNRYVNVYLNDEDYGCSTGSIRPSARATRL